MRGSLPNHSSSARHGRRFDILSIVRPFLIYLNFLRIYYMPEKCKVYFYFFSKEAYLGGEQGCSI